MYFRNEKSTFWFSGQPYWHYSSCATSIRKSSQWHFNSKVDDFNQEIKNYCSSTEDIKFINNKLISSLDPSLYSDGVHFSDAGKRNLVRIIKFHLNPFIGLKPYNNYSPPANRKPAQFRNYKNDYSGQRNRQGDQRGKQYN